MALLSIGAVPFLLGAACTKKGDAKPTDTGAIEAGDRVEPAGPVDTTPLPGIDVSKLASKKQQLFYKLVGSLSSPCGKAHSLRTSVVSDQTCKRAPFAAKLVVAMLEDEATEADVKQEYNDKYNNKAAPKVFKLDGVPHHGPADAPIVLVEFYDYGCSACQAFKPVLEQVLGKYKSEVVVYYKQFPIAAKHPESPSAARAALAAHKQEKFAPMHDLLFQRAPEHRREQVIGYAKQLGLDMQRFEADYDGAAALVEADQKEGDAAGVDHTPTLFFNGMEYKGPTQTSKYLGMWVEEEIAVNR